MMISLYSFRARHRIQSCWASLPVPAAGPAPANASQAALHAAWAAIDRSRDSCIVTDPARAGGGDCGVWTVLAAGGRPGESARLGIRAAGACPGRPKILRKAGP